MTSWHSSAGRWLFALTLSATAVAPLACARGRGEMVTLKGSDTMVILGQRWAERFIAEHPDQSVQVTGGGSGTGIANLINGTTDICQSSRAMKEAEKQQLVERVGQPPQEIVVARDGLTVYVNEANPIQELSIEQVRDVYRGKIRNWQELGGGDAPIVLYGRENNSGTYVYFKEHVLDEQDFASEVQTLPGTAAVVHAVASDANGIGYGGAAYKKGIRDVAIRKDAGSPAVRAGKETVLDGSYPLSRPLYFYLARAPEGSIKQFVEFVLSDAGQAVVTEVDYFPVR
jgi:phosphate transport system substrate-binding protein